jgi:hypothetical protein
MEKNPYYSHPSLPWTNYVGGESKVLKFFEHIFFKSSEMHSDENPQPWTFKIPTEKLGYKNRGK